MYVGLRCNGHSFAHTPSFLGADDRLLLIEFLVAWRNRQCQVDHTTNQFGFLVFSHRGYEVETTQKNNNNTNGTKGH